MTQLWRGAAPTASLPLEKMPHASNTRCSRSSSPVVPSISSAALGPALPLPFCVAAPVVAVASQGFPPAALFPSCRHRAPQRHAPRNLLLLKRGIGSRLWAGTSPELAAASRSGSTEGSWWLWARPSLSCPFYSGQLSALGEHLPQLAAGSCPGLTAGSWRLRARPCLSCPFCSGFGRSRPAPPGVRGFGPGPARPNPERRQAARATPRKP